MVIGGLRPYRTPLIDRLTIAQHPAEKQADDGLAPTK